MYREIRGEAARCRWVVFWQRFSAVGRAERFRRFLQSDSVDCTKKLIILPLHCESVPNLQSGTFPCNLPYHVSEMRMGSSLSVLVISSFESQEHMLSYCMYDKPY